MRPSHRQVHRGVLVLLAVCAHLVRHLCFSEPSCYSLSCSCVQHQSTGPTVVSIGQVRPTLSLYGKSFSCPPVGTVGSVLPRVFRDPASNRCSSALPSSQSGRHPSSLDAPSALPLSVLEFFPIPPCSQSQKGESRFRRKNGLLCWHRVTGLSRLVRAVMLGSSTASLSVFRHGQARAAVGAECSVEKKAITQASGLSRALLPGRGSAATVPLLTSSFPCRRPPTVAQSQRYFCFRSQDSLRSPSALRTCLPVPTRPFQFSVPPFFSSPYISTSSPGLFFLASLYARTQNQSGWFGGVRQTISSLRAKDHGGDREIPADVSWPAQAAPAPGLRAPKWTVDDEGHFKILSQ